MENFKAVTPFDNSDVYVEDLRDLPDLNLQTLVTNL
jgi:hypothetical protein